MSRLIPDAEIDALRSAVDNSIVADNIIHLADFVVEKYEYARGRPLASSVRDTAIVEIKRTLWEFMDRVRHERKLFLRELFVIADEAVAEAMQQ